MEIERRRVLGGLAAGLAATVLPGAGAGLRAQPGREGGACVWDRKAGTPPFDRAVRDVVIANRILATEGVTDAYGHVSIRHPEDRNRFLIAVSRSPSLVTPADILQFNLDGTPAGDDRRQSYLERFIHGGIYRARPDVMAVAHSHSTEVLPFTLGSTQMKIVTHSAGVVGEHVPVWDIRTKFGDTNLLVDDDAKGRDLARALGPDNVVLMRGHGYAAAAGDLIELIRICVYLGINARVLLEAGRLGKITPLSPGEIRKVKDVERGSSSLIRAWNYWAQRADCTALLAP